VTDYNRLLSGWFHERQQQLQESLGKTIRNGSLCTEGSSWKFAVTKLVLQLMQLAPPLNRMLEKGPRAAGPIRYKWQNGLPFLGNAYGGITIPQVYCYPVSSSLKDLGVSFTDDVIFQRDKKGMFQLVVSLESHADLDAARKALPNLDTLSGNYIIPHEATFILHTSEVKEVPADIGNDVWRLATADEFVNTSDLCKGRPAPEYYDMFQIRKALYGKSFAIVRPDRFLYAACDTAQQLQTICGGIQQTLGLR
jgi:hypothetical protein